MNKNSFFVSSILPALSALALLGTTSILSAATWDGDTNDNWSIGTNWSDNADPAGKDIVFNDTDTSGTQGTTTNIVDADITVNTLTYSNTGSNYHTTGIPTGTTLTVNGTGTALRVGVNYYDTTVTMNGGGNLSITGGSGATISINQPTNWSNKTATLDLSGLNTFTANVGSFFVAPKLSAKAELTLAPTSNITASTELAVGGRYIPLDNGDIQANGTIHLGQSTTISTPILTVGGGRSSIGIMDMQGDGSGATVKIRGTSGETSRASINIGRTGWNSTSATGTLNFENAAVDAKFDTVIMGEGCSSHGSQVGSGTLYLNNGTIDANTVELGRSVSNDSTPEAGRGQGILNLGGGTFTAGTITLANRATSYEPTGNNQGIINLNGGTLEATTIRAGNGIQADRIINFNSGTIKNKTGGDLTISGLTTFDIAGAEASHVFEADTDRTITVDSDMSGTGGITKTGGGTLDLNGTVTITGDVHVDAGTLDVADLGTFALGSGQTLSGNGTIVGRVTVANGAILAPGNSPGTTTYASDQIWGGGGIYEWEIQDWTGSAGAIDGWDLISITDTESDPNLTITATPETPFIIKITEFSLTNFAVSTLEQTFEILSADGGISGFDASYFTLDTTAWTQGGTWGIIQDGNSLKLTYIPEPASLVLLGLGAVALLHRRRR